MNDLLEAIAVKECTSGILLASKYVSGIYTCWSDEKCAERFKSLGSSDQWDACVKEAAKRLVYRNEDMEFLQKAAKLTKGACMDFECVITSTRIDRDDDVLEAKGADLDKSMPLLWQHVPLMPCGKFVNEVSAATDKRAGAFSIVDSEFGRDAAQLVEFKALRISHGFRPLKYEPRKVEKDQRPGWHILKYEIMETSLVSVPSNIDAEITLFSRGKLHHPLVKSVAEGHYRSRPAMVRGGWDGAAELGAPLTVNVNINGTLAGQQAPDKAACCTGLKIADVPETKPAVSAEVPADGKAATPDATKGMFIGLAYFEKSFEWVTDQLEDSARGLLFDGEAVETRDIVGVIGTFDDAAVLCLLSRDSDFYYGPYSYSDNDFDDDDGYSYWRYAWASVGGKPTWSGTPTKVELTTAIRQAAKGLFMKRAKSGRACSAKNAALLKDAAEVIGEVGDHAKTSADHKTKCKDACVQLKEVYGTDEDKVNPVTGKAGRVLSKENLERVSKAADSVVEMADHKDMHRLGKSGLREAASYLKEVMSNANPEAEVNGEANPGIDPDPEITGRSADDLAAKLVGTLACGQKLAPGVLVTLKEIVDLNFEELPDRLLV